MADLAKMISDIADIESSIRHLITEVKQHLVRRKHVGRRRNPGMRVSVEGAEFFIPLHSTPELFFFVPLCLDPETILIKFFEMILLVNVIQISKKSFAPLSFFDDLRFLKFLDILKF